MYPLLLLRKKLRNCFLMTGNDKNMKAGVHSLNGNLIVQPHMDYIVNIFLKIQECTHSISKYGGAVKPYTPAT